MCFDLSLKQSFTFVFQFKLLSGRVPQADDYSRCRKRKLTFRSQEWRNISTQAKDLINGKLDAENSLIKIVILQVAANIIV